jgi:hypothetical protein
MIGMIIRKIATKPLLAGGQGICHPTPSPPTRRPSPSSSSARPSPPDARGGQHATCPSCRCAGRSLSDATACRHDTPISRQVFRCPMAPSGMAITLQGSIASWNRNSPKCSRSKLAERSAAGIGSGPEPALVPAIPRPARVGRPVRPLRRECRRWPGERPARQN